MTSADNPTETSVTAGETSAKVSNAPRPLIKRRLTLIIVVIIIVLVAAGSGYYLWHKHQQKMPSSTLSAGQSAVNMAIEQANQGNTNSALNTLNTAINNTTDGAQKSALYVQQASTYENAQNYQAALTSFQKAAQYGGLTYGLAQNIAETAQQVGNKQLAIQYYQKAINLIPANDPVGHADKQGFETAINSLEGQ
jgi:tetratricopeptide (TPR) repeat protein